MRRAITKICYNPTWYKSEERLYGGYCWSFMMKILFDTYSSASLGQFDVGQPGGFYTVGSTLSVAQDNTLQQNAGKVSKKVRKMKQITSDRVVSTFSCSCYNLPDTTMHYLRARPLRSSSFRRRNEQNQQEHCSRRTSRPSFASLEETLSQTPLHLVVVLRWES